VQNTETGGVRARHIWGYNTHL